MTIRRSRKANDKHIMTRKRRLRRDRRSDKDRRNQIETLETRRVLAAPQLIGIQPNDGALLQDQDVRNVAPLDLTFRFDENQGISIPSLGDSATIGGIQVTGSGFDGDFEAAKVSSDLNTGGAVEVEFTAVRLGQAQNGIRILVNKADQGGAGLPVVSVNGNSIFANLNTNVGNESTAQDLIDAINSHPQASNLVTGAVVAGDSLADIATPNINYSPLLTGGANDMVVHPGFIGLGENPHEVVLRFAESLPDDIYRIEVFGSGPTILRNSAGEVFNDGEDFQLDFRLDLGPQILAVDPQPVTRNDAGVLEQHGDQIVVHFNNDNLDASTASNPEFYQLIYVNDTVENTDDVKFNPTSVAYDADSDTAVLTFASNIEDLATGAGTYRLRIGSDEAAPIAPGSLRPVASASADLGGVELDFVGIGEEYGKNLTVNFTSADLGDLAPPEVTVRDEQITVQLNTTAGSESTADAVVTAINGHFRASQLVVATIANGDPATVIPVDSASIQLQGLGSSFSTATNLEGSFDTGHAILVSGTGAELVDGQWFTILDAQGTEHTFEFDSDATTSIAGAIAVSFTAADDQATVLTAIVDAINNAGLTISAAQAGDDLITISGDIGVSIDPTTRAVELSSQGLIISSRIDPQIYELQFPGGNDEPGHRDIESQKHVPDGAFDVEPGISTFAYNFRPDIGLVPGPGGLFVDAFNVITDAQKARIREIFEFYGSVAGVQFYETETEGFVIATGDMRVINPMAPNGPGGLDALSGPDFNFGRPTLVVDPQDLGANDDSFGALFMQVAMREIGGLLGLGSSLELPPLTIQGDDDTGDSILIEPLTGLPVTTDMNGQILDNDVEPIFPGDGDVIHANYIYRSESKDIDLYQFTVDVAPGKQGVFTAETIAERRRDSSLLDTALSLFRQNDDGSYELIARNDDYFSNDSYIELQLNAGTYFVGVSSTGNTEYDPIIEDTGLGGTTEGGYDLRLNFRPAAENSLRDDPVDLIISGRGSTIVDGQIVTFTDGGGTSVAFEFDRDGQQVDANATPIIFNSGTTSFELTSRLQDAINASALSTTAAAFGSQIRFDSDDVEISVSTNTVGIELGILGTQFDGDSDGRPGGVYNFWFRAQPNQRSISVTGDGSTLVDGQVFSITDGDGLTRRFEFNNTDTPNQPVDPTAFQVSYNNGSTAADIAQTLINFISNASFGVTAVVDADDPSTLNLTGDHSIQESSPLVDVVVNGKTIFVDKNNDPDLNLDVPAGLAIDGSLTNPLHNLQMIANTARPGDNVRIVGNPGADGDLMTLGDNLSYQIGFNTLGQSLPDGPSFQVPQGVTVMVDQHAIFQLRRARIGVGSSLPGIDRSAGSLQVLGTPRVMDDNGDVIVDEVGNPLPGMVYFTSYDDEETGRDTNPFPTTPGPGDWGGIVFRDDIDAAAGNFLYQNEGINLNYVAHADLRYGGGNVNIGAVSQVVSSIHITDTRPTIIHNQIMFSADAAISASPNSLEESNFHAPRHQLIPFTSDYSRIGPEVYANTIRDNSINGLFIRLETPAGGDLTQLTVSGRINDRDLVYGIEENLVIAGTPGGPIEEFDGPPTRLITHDAVMGGTLASGQYTYRLTYVDAFGAESVPSNEVPLTAIDNGAGEGSIQLTQLPPVPQGGDFVARRLYRSDETGAGPFTLVAQINGLDETFLDDGTTRGGELDSPSVSATTLAGAPMGMLVRGTYNYKFVFIDSFGEQQIPTGATADLTILGDPDPNGNPGNGSIQLGNIPVGDADVVTVQIFRSDALGNGPYSFVAEIPNGQADFLDDGTMGDPTQLLHELFRARPDARLKVDPSVVVKLDGARIEAWGGGQLIAEGKDGLEVTFTSVQDDRFGAGTTFDTTNDGTGTQPSPGDWGGLFLAHLSSGSIDHGLVAYAGGVNRVEGTFVGFNPVEIHQSDVRIAHSIFEFNADGSGGQGQEERFGRGFNEGGVIFVRGAQPIIIDNVLRFNDAAAININVNSLNHELVRDTGRSSGELDRLEGFRDNQGPLIHGNLLGDNTINGMMVRGETLSTQSVWDDVSIVHVLFDTVYVPDYHTYGGLRIESSPNESLVVKLQDQDPTGLDPDVPDFAGFWAFGRPLEINDRIGGILQVIGQPGSPVVFTSFLDDTHGAGFRPDGDPQSDTNNDQVASIPAPGDWRGLRIDKFAHDRNVEIVTEREPRDINTPGNNATPEDAQFIGQLAAHEYDGDENLRLGYTIHGFLNDTNDIDIFSFNADAGTEIWIDVDRTTHALDSVIELLDGDGNVLARSDNSFAESEGSEELFVAPGVDAFTMQKVDGLGVTDYYSTNQRDPAMRLVLPGGLNTNNTYHMRIRSSSDDLSDLGGGLTSGAYQMELRLRELDEFGGSVVTFATVSYAINGIELLGQPVHSPITGEYAEPAEFIPDPTDPTGTVVIPNRQNDDPTTAVQLGNLLQSDRGTISVGGRLEVEGTPVVANAPTADVDWFSFEVTGQEGGGGPYETVFDLDYADGLARPNTAISVFDAAGTLLFSGRSSNVSEDRPGPGQNSDLTDLDRGTVGPADPYIGPISLPDGNYFVAVHADLIMPAQLDQFTTAAATNPMLRLEPIAAINRIVEDRGLQPIPPHPPTSTLPPTQHGHVELFDADSPVAFHLGDVTLYAAIDVDPNPEAEGTTVFTIDPYTGQVETVVNDSPLGSNPSFLTDVGDIAFRGNGDLHALSVDLEDLNGPEDDEAGNYILIDSSNGTAQNLGDDGIITYEESANAPGVPVRANLRQDGRVGFGVHFEAMAFGIPPGRQAERLLAVGFRGDVGIDNGVDAKTNLLYQFDPVSGVQEINPGGSTLFEGDRLPITGNAATDAIEIDELLTSARLTTLDASQPGPAGAGTTFLIEDNGATTFSIFDGVGTTVFEFDAGPEIAQQVNIDNMGTIIPGNTIRDGNFFILDGDVETEDDEWMFQINTGAVIVIGGTSGDIADGQTITVQSATGVGTTFEFDNNAEPINTGDEIIDIAGAVGPNGIASFLAQAINDSAVGTEGNVVARAIGNRVTLVNDAGAQIGPDPLDPGGPPTPFLQVFGGGGPAPVMRMLSGGEINDGDVITVTFNDGQPPAIFEFDSGGGIGPDSVAVPFDINDTPEDIATALHNEVASFGPQISGQLVGDSVVINGPDITVTTNANGIVDLTQVLNYVAINAEEDFTNDELSALIGNPTGPNTLVQGVVNTESPFAASGHGTRINFPPIDGATPVEAADFTGVPVWNDIQSATGVAPGNIAIPFGARDEAADYTVPPPIDMNAPADVFDGIATRVADAINAAYQAIDPVDPPIVATAGRDAIRFNRGVVTATGNLVSEGSGPGGNIEGMAYMGGQLFAVSDNGGLYTITGDFRAVINPFATATYVETSANDLEGIEFAGLTAGPPGVEDGRYANLLFGIDIDGNLYAFDGNGVLQPIFEDGQTSVNTGLVDVVGIDFAGQLANLWQPTPLTPTPQCRQLTPADPGHGTTASVGGTGDLPDFTPDGIGDGLSSWYFGLISPAACVGYNIIGGAHGSMVSNDFSLKGYSASDQPTFYFNYFAATDAAGVGQDQIRVSITDNTGDWTQIAGSVFYNQGWRQMRIPLDGFAGRENLRLRFDFTTAGELNIGDPRTTGEELRTPAGVYIADGDQLTIMDEDTMIPVTFEFDSGITLELPSGAGIPVGERFTIDDGANSVVFQYDDDNVFPDNISTVGGLLLADGETFEVSDAGQTVTFELDSGYVITVPADGSFINDMETFTINEGTGGPDVVFEFDNDGTGTGDQIINVIDNLTLNVPLDGGNLIADSEDFTVTDGTTTVIFEFDSNGNVNPGRTPISIVDNRGLQVPDVGGGFGGIADGETFTIDDGQGNVVVFEFDSNGMSNGDVTIEIDVFTTQDVAADRIAAAINTAMVNGMPIGVQAENAGNGQVVVSGLTPTHVLDTATTSLTESLLPLTQDDVADLIADAVTGAMLGLVGSNEGDGVVVLNGTTSTHAVNTLGTLELTDDVTPRTQDEIADRIVNAILAANIGLMPTNLGDGFVHVGGTTHVLDTAGTMNVGQAGEPGLQVPGTVAVPFVPTNTGEEVAMSVADAINNSGLNVTASALGALVELVDATGFSPGNTAFTPEGVVPIFVSPTQTASDIALLTANAITLQTLAGNLNVTTHLNNHPDLDAHRINLEGAALVTQDAAPGALAPSILLDGEAGLNTGSAPDTWVVPFHTGMGRSEVILPDGTIVEGVAEQLDAVLEQAFVNPRLVTDASTAFADGDRFFLNDSVNPTVTFEFETGFILEIPASGGSTIPSVADPNPNGIVDGVTFTLTQGVNSVTFEFDKDGLTVPGNEIIPISEAFSQLAVQGAIATAVQDYIANNGLVQGLIGQALSGGLVQLGGDPGTELTIDAGSTLTMLPGAEPGVSGAVTFEVAQPLTVTMPDFFTLHIPQTGFLDGESFTVDDGANPPVLFEFEDTNVGNGLSDANAIEVTFNNTMTQDQIADAIAQAITAEIPDVTATNLGNGAIFVGTTNPGLTVEASNSHIRVAGTPAVITDGQAFSITDGANTSTFEFDSDGGTNDPNATALAFSDTTTPDDFVTLVVNAMNNAGLGFMAADLGSGEIFAGAPTAAHQFANNSALCDGNAQCVGVSEPLRDGEFFVLSDGVDTVTFEFDADGMLNDATAVAIPTTNAGVPMNWQELAESVAVAVEDANIGFVIPPPVDGVINLNAQPNHTFDLAGIVDSGLTLVGMPGGSPDVIAVGLSPSVNNSASDVAEDVADAINRANAGNRLNITANILPSDTRRVELTAVGGLSTGITFDPGTSAITWQVSDDVIKSYRDLITLMGRLVTDPGPIGYDGPLIDVNIPSHPGDIPNPAIPLNPIGFGNPFGLSGVDRVGFHNPTRLQDNAFEGLYVDDFIIGFAERGELAYSWDDPGRSDFSFALNPAASSPLVTIYEGEYQLEIRGVENINAEARGFDTNDRMSQSLTIGAQAGAEIWDGQTLTLTDGVDTVVFEYNDLSIGDGIQQGRIQVPFLTSDPDFVVAQTLRDVINGPDTQAVLDISAAIGDGTIVGPGNPTLSTDNRVNLFGPISIVTHEQTVPEVNDIIEFATVTGIDGLNSLPYLAQGEIGDNETTRSNLVSMWISSKLR